MSIGLSEQRLKLSGQIAAVLEKEAYRRFMQRFCSETAIKQAVLTFRFNADDLLPYLNSLDPQHEFLFFNEKATYKKTIAAGGSLREVTASGTDRFLTIQQKIVGLKNETLHFNAAANGNIGFHILGGFSFFDEIESTGWNGFKSASFTLPKRTLVKTGDHTTISLAITKKPSDSADEIHQKIIDELLTVKADSSFNASKDDIIQTITQTSPVDFDDWENAILDVKEKISNKEFDKIVLARQLNLSSKNKFNTVATLAYFRKYYSNCSSYLIRGNQSGTFIGCSPERLLSFSDIDYETEALAGSMPRGKTDEEDKNLENRLLKSRKNLEEHKLVIDHFKKYLQPIIRKIEITEAPVVKKFANVHHLFSPIRFQPISDVSPLQILSRLHPTPALGGYPQHKAVEYLAENCLIKRGWFGAPVGWLNTNGSGEFTVAIRCGIVNEYTAKLFAGCGIMSTSNVSEEWEESNVKFKPMLTALTNEQT